VIVWQALKISQLIQHKICQVFGEIVQVDALSLCDRYDNGSSINPRG
jgi:hypothetical protein